MHHIKLVLHALNNPARSNLTKALSMPLRAFSQVVPAKSGGKIKNKDGDDEEEIIELPEELRSRLNRFPARLTKWESFKMPGSPYKGMGPLPPVPDYDDVKKDLKFYFIPKSWFDLFEPKTGKSGPYLFAFTFFTFLASKEIYMFGHTYGHHSRQIFWSFVTFGLMNKHYGYLAKDFVEDWRTKRIRAYDDIKEEEVRMVYAEQQHINKIKYQAGLYEPVNEVKKMHLDVMLETNELERKAQAADLVKKKLDYMIGYQYAMKEVNLGHMAKWIEDKAMESINRIPADEVIKACITDLKAAADKYNLAHAK